LFKRFSDFSQESQRFDGDKVKIEAILNKEIKIIGARIAPSKRNEGNKYLTVQFEMEDSKYIIFTGSSVLIDQLTKYNDEIPFMTTVRKIGNYYTLS
jgi:hypothetical protein